MDADVIVIGAGAAGLAAAQWLADQSARVILLEARDRIGGRVWSRPVPHSSAPAELGAEFIHGPAPKTMALLGKAGSAAIPVDGESWICEKGSCLRLADQDFRSAAHIFENARSLPHDESVDRFLRDYGADDATREAAEWARAFVEGFDAADPAIASVKAIADEWRSGVDSETRRPRGGYAPMFDYLHRACIAAGVDLRLSETVHRISWRRGKVGVKTRRAGAESQIIHARAAIITLPVGVLKRDDREPGIAFEPDLPESKKRALQHIEMGHALRVALWFRTAFWHRLNDGRYRNAAFFRGEGLPFATYWTELPERSTLIVAWAGGPKAVALCEASEAELIERALDGVGEIFGEPSVVREEFEGGDVHDWGRDPLARGAYSYALVGGAHARAELAAPLDDTLLFAGEATSTDGQGGTVNGALETGERSAKEAATMLGIKKR